VSIIYRTTMAPAKLELLRAWLPTRSWYRPTGRAPELARAGGFRLDDPEGEVGIEFMVAADTSGGADPTAYLVPMTYRAAPARGAQDDLIGTSEHGVLGQRWIYDATRDPVFAAVLVALIQGEAQPQAQGQSHTLDHTVHQRAVDAPARLVPAEFTALDGVAVTELSITLAAPAPAGHDAAELAGTVVAGTPGDAAVTPAPGGPAAPGPGGAPGPLIVHVARVLSATGYATAGLEPVSLGGLGYVTATWRPADGEREVRGVFATAGLGPGDAR
jgi:hypothetical protein